MAALFIKNEDLERRQVRFRREGCNAHRSSGGVGGEALPLYNKKIIRRRRRRRYLQEIQKATNYTSAFTIKTTMTIQISTIGTA